MIPPPRNLLVSFAYYKRIDLDKLAACRIVGDSGAYTMKKLGKVVTTRQVAGWVQKWQHRLAWAAAIDIANNIQQTRDNWKAMCDFGFPAVSTLHVGDDPSEMDWYADQGVDFLGLGGMAGSTISPDVQFRWLIKVFKYARDNHPEMRFHGWGMARNEWLRLPFFSIDSSGWGSGYRFGRVVLRHPITGENIGVALNGKATYSPKVAEMLAEHYGVTPSMVSKSVPENRMLMVKLSALSASVQEQQIRAIHRKAPVTPPKWGRLGGWDLPPGPNQHLALGGCGAGLREVKVMQELHATGPHLHLVDGHPQHIQWVADMAEGKL